MRKRTRIAVVAAALAFGTVAVSAVGAAGSDRAGTGQAATARAQTGGTTAGQHVGDDLQPLLAGAPRIDWDLVDVVIRRLKGRMPPVQRRGELLDKACKVKDMVVLENAPPSIRNQFPPPIATPPSWLDPLTNSKPQTLEQWRNLEIKARLERMAGWGKSTASQRATLLSLTKDLATAEDYSDGAKIAVDLFCWGGGLHYDAKS